MRLLFRIASVAILPLAVYCIGMFAGPRISGGPPVAMHDQLSYAVTNSLIFAAPQFLWLAIALLCRFTSRVCDAGLAAADAVLILFCILISIQSDTHAGILWLGYLPLAFIASLVTGGIIRAATQKV